MNKLVIFSGLPGTGKSTFATRLARTLLWPLLCIDDVIGEVPENPGFPFWDSRISILLDLIETQLKIGIDVIVDSVFMNTDRHHAQELAKKYQASFLPIHVFVSDENLWKERVTTRLAESNIPDVADWEGIQQQRLHFRPWEPDTALFIDSAQAEEQNFQQILVFVKSEKPNLKPLPVIPLVKGRYHA